MRFYNSASGAVESFAPHGSTVRMYVCGVTPYDTTHLGHAFTYVVFDVLARVIERHGLTVRYVQNVTDVDDPLFERARATGEPWRQLAQRQMAQFLDDLSRLNCRPVDERPYVSTEVPSMIAMIRGLEERGFTYRIGDRLYFRTRLAPQYGALGQVSREYQLQRAKETGNDPAFPGKEDPLDFLLWQPSADDEPAWDSPWGPGRPGWHIECSAMSLTHLGEQIDIHGGGQDLVFPHHASEIAQSEAFTGKAPFSRFWMHTGMVRLDGVKMSKSLGNLIFTRDLLDRYDPNTVRLYVLNHRYRFGWDHSESELAEAHTLARRIYQIVSSSSEERTERVAALRQQAMAQLDDDLDTPGAIASLRDLVALGPTAATAIREIAMVLGLRLPASD